MPLISLLLTLYRLAWMMATPFLRRTPRLAEGWSQRTLADGPHGPFDLWIQAASGGESLLTGLLLEFLDAQPETGPLRILATSGTRQGIDTLTKAKQRLAKSRLAIDIAYFPLDSPSVMARAFTRYAPKLAVIIETELWPGFLVAAKEQGVPVFLVNGRMSAKSYSSYRYLRTFFHRYGPRKIWAISPSDCERFAAICGQEEGRVNRMDNMKFDRIEPQFSAAAHGPVAKILPPKTPFVLLGSIRREEEEKVLTTITTLIARRRELVIGLFPKHIERAEQWQTLLAGKGLPHYRRSATITPVVPGSVIIWDVFGELAGAYGLAAATFVGGSLLPLGGQNFLEPLVFGMKPIIGLHWQNFAWVGREIVTAGLVAEVKDEETLAKALLTKLDNREEREKVLAEVQAFFAPRKGGTALVGRQISAYLMLQTCQAKADGPDGKKR